MRRPKLNKLTRKLLTVGGENLQPDPGSYNYNALFSLTTAALVVPKKKIFIPIKNRFPHSS